jgi:type I restriction enzyme, S subunit
MKNVPEIRLKGFDREWVKNIMENLIKINSGCDYKQLQNGPIPVYGTGGYMLSVDKALSYKEDAIGIGRKGTIDHPYILFAPFWTVDTLFYSIPKENFDINFLYDIFQNIDWKSLDESTGVPSLSKVNINNIEVSIPHDIKEQQTIGVFFQNLDNLLAEQKNKLENLQKVKKSMLCKMFPKEGQKVPEIRFKGYEEDWEEKKLGDMGHTFTGLSGKNKSDFGHGKGRYITYMNVFSNPIASLNQIENIEIDNSQCKVKYGDVFFTTSSETPEEVGISSVWLRELDNVYLNSFCFGYRLLVHADPYFMAYYLRSSYFRRRITFLAQGISRFNISKNKVMEIEIFLPPTEEQQLIGNYFKSLDELIKSNQDALENIKHFKQSCLQKMFV